MAQQAPLMTVLLVPAGDARNQGRSLEHQFESTSSMACVLSLKAALEKTYPEMRVIVSHKAGDIVQQYQIPTMAIRWVLTLWLLSIAIMNRGQSLNFYLSTIHTAQILLISLQN